MERLTFTYPARAVVARRVHIGRRRLGRSGGSARALGGLRRTRGCHAPASTAFGAVWKHVLDRFFTRFDGAAAIEINDFGATPGVVMLRLEQAAEALRA